MNMGTIGRVVHSWIRYHAIVGVGATTGFVATCLGLWLILPIETFASSPALRVLYATNSEPWIGVLLVSGAVLGWRANVQQNVLFEIVATALLAGVWVYLSAGTLAGNPAGPGWVVYASLAILDCWVSISRLKGARSE